MTKNMELGKKGCFILQRRFAYIGHDIAVHLKERYGLTNFCGYVFTRPSYTFLRSQKDIVYTHLLLDEDIDASEPVDHVYLVWLEKEYGLPYLWPYLAVDRILMSGQLLREYPYDKPTQTHEEMLRFLQARAKAIIAFLDREKPDYLFCSAIGAVGSYLLYAIAKKRGITICDVLPTLIRDRYIVSDSPFTFTTVDARYQDLTEADLQSPAGKEAAEFLKTFREQPKPWLAKLDPSIQAVSRRKQFAFLRPSKAYKWIRTFSRTVRAYYTNDVRSDYSTISPWNYLKDVLKRRLRNIIGVDDLYDPFDPKTDFAFFPLHLEPEIALLLQAPYQTDQAHLILQIARSLPVQYTLYVKDHPQMVEFRPRAFYERIKKMPNVKLIDPSIKSFDIIPHAKLITTITGTVGWEATLLKRPVISFGHWFYNALPMVKRNSEMERLPSLIREQLDAFAYDEVALHKYLTALFQDSVVSNLHQLWEDETDQEKKQRGVRRIADAIARHLGIGSVHT